MKWIVLIWLMLSGLFPSGMHDVTVPDCHETLVSHNPQALPAGDGFRSTSLHQMPLASYSGEETSTLAAPVRTLSQSRQGGHSIRSNFRVIRAGKVLDKCISCSYRRAFAEAPSGHLSPSKYLHSIRILLI